MFKSCGLKKCRFLTLSRQIHRDRKVEGWLLGGGRKWVGSCFIGIEFQFCKIKRILEICAAIMWMYLTLLNCKLQLVMMVNCILCAFYHILKNIKTPSSLVLTFWSVTVSIGFNIKYSLSSLGVTIVLFGLQLVMLAIMILSHILHHVCLVKSAVPL